MIPVQPSWLTTSQIQRKHHRGLTSNRQPLSLLQQAISKPTTCILPENICFKWPAMERNSMDSIPKLEYHKAPFMYSLHKIPNRSKQGSLRRQLPAPQANPLDDSKRHLTACPWTLALVRWALGTWQLLNLNYMVATGSENWVIPWYTPKNCGLNGGKWIIMMMKQFISRWMGYPSAFNRISPFRKTPQFPHGFPAASGTRSQFQSESWFARAPEDHRVAGGWRNDESCGWYQ